MNNNNLYRETRGVMTQFLPLTEEHLSQIPNSISFHELADELSHQGLSILNVVHDPSRQLFNTYYADYDRGLYSSIMLSRESFSQVLSALLQSVAAFHGQLAPELANQKWKTYYAFRVPLPIAIYDFQRRYRDIPPNEVFSVWYSIYKRIDYSNNMWLPEVLDYVFSQAPPSNLPPPDADGLITIYRGTGELSSPPKQAISWSTHPGNALWFANHTGRGAHIAVARIHPEQIVAYYNQFSLENEVIVKPGTVKEYQYEDMIPAEYSTVPKLLSSGLIGYIQFGRQAVKLGYPKESLPFQAHGLKHILRVLMLSLIYIHNSGDLLSRQDRQILIYFSLLHDIGRTNEERDDTHGEKSISVIHKRDLHIDGLKMSKKDIKIAELIILHHCHDDGVGEEANQNASGFSQKDRARATHLYHICKDMDGLDRVRFNGLDYRMLRTPYAKRLPLVAGCLLEEQVVKVLDWDISNFVN